MQKVAIGWTIFIVVVVPLQAIATRHRVKKEQPARRRAYTSTIGGLLVLGAITLLIDWRSNRVGLNACQLLYPNWRTLTWAAGTFLVCAVIWWLGMWERKLFRQNADEVVALLLPRTADERQIFVGVAIVAGVVEEYVMRGFCFLILAQLLHSVAISLLLVSLAFALAHGYQGPAAILRSGLLGAVLAVPVIFTGSVVPSMIAHTGTDLVACFCGYSFLRRWNLLGDG
jgi:membrane protease YdiL (CAAX protease family)